MKGSKHLGAALAERTTNYYSRKLSPNPIRQVFTTSPQAKLLPRHRFERAERKPSKKAVYYDISSSLGMCNNHGGGGGYGYANVSTDGKVYCWVLRLPT